MKEAITHAHIPRQRISEEGMSGQLDAQTVGPTFVPEGEAAQVGTHAEAPVSFPRTEAAKASADDFLARMDAEISAFQKDIHRAPEAPAPDVRKLSEAEITALDNVTQLNDLPQDVRDMVHGKLAGHRDYVREKEVEERAGEELKARARAAADKAYDDSRETWEGHYDRQANLHPALAGMGSKLFAKQIEDRAAQRAEEAYDGHRGMVESRAADYHDGSIDQALRALDREEANSPSARLAELRASIANGKELPEWAAEAAKEQAAAEVAAGTTAETIAEPKQVEPGLYRSGQHNGASDAESGSAQDSASQAGDRAASDTDDLGAIWDNLLTSKGYVQSPGVPSATDLSAQETKARSHRVMDSGYHRFSKKFSERARRLGVGFAAGAAALAAAVGVPVAAQSSGDAAPTRNAPITTTHTGHGGNTPETGGAKVDQQTPEDADIQLGGNGDSIWAETVKAAEARGRHLTEAQKREVVGAVLKANGQTWESARHLPDGFKFQIKQSQLQQILNDLHNRAE